QDQAGRPDWGHQILLDCGPLNDTVTHEPYLKEEGLNDMKTTWLQSKSLTASALLCGILSTSYAHAAPLYSCVYENTGDNSRFEVSIREESSEAAFSYKFTPRGETAAVQGQMIVEKTDVTWSHFVFTGSDANAQVKLSVPAGLQDTSIYMKLAVTLDGNTFDSIQYLGCKRAR
ncbi:MAG: hypothetical protein EBR09_16540, partial [Proteobacteria bacterium]|nr:hypothetical protein [Pseudomonadota bacterium]